MTHPTQQQLLAWLDGDVEAGARAEDTAAHVAGCARCQGVVDAAQDLGAAVRLWSEDAAPAPVPDLADLIFRAAGAPSAAPEAQTASHANGAAAVTAQSAGANGAAGPSVASRTPHAPDRPAGATGGQVVSLAARRRWWLAAAPVALAAAAAAVFLLTRSPGTGTGPGTTSPTPHPAPQIAAHVDSGAPPANPETPGTNPAPQPPPVNLASAEGSEVLAVDPDGDDNTNVSVMEIADEQAGPTVAVVWIDEQGPAGGSTIQ